MRSMSKTLVAASLLAVTGPVAAETTWNGISFSGNATIGTDYVFRGFSQTNENPTIQGGFDAAHESGFYAGVWASNVDFGENAATLEAVLAGDLLPADAALLDEPSIEIDFYGGFAGELGDLGLGYDIGAIYYMYPGSDSSLDYGYWEIYGKGSYDFGDLGGITPSANAAIYYSPEYFGGIGSAINYDIGMDFGLPYDLTFGGYVGFQTFDDTSDYTHWKIYGAYSVLGFDLELAYYDTDVKSKLSDSRVVFSASRSF